MVRGPMRSVAVLLCVFAALGLSGCKSKCRQLSEKLCDCSINSVEKENCIRRAQNAEGINPPTATDETYCDSLLTSCDCRLIDTPQGKVNCGLARGPLATPQ
jgi:hypothetical protein